MPPPINDESLYERSNVPPHLLPILCDFAALDVQRPLTPHITDWETVLEYLLKNGLLGNVYYYLAQNRAGDYPPPAFRAAVQERFQRSAIRMALIQREVVKVLTALNEADCPYFVVKGPVLAQRFYPNPNLRAFNDLDLVVRESDWVATHKCLTAAGYVQEENLPKPPPQISPKIVVYECKYVHPQTGFRVEVHYDDLFNAGIRSRTFEEIWIRTQWMTLGGVYCRALSTEDQLAHLCSHIHYHGYTRLNWFTDILLILRDHSHQIHWGLFSQIVRTEELEVPVYYTLLLLQTLFGVSAPPALVRTLKPDAFRCWWHEYYLPTPALLNFQPMPRPDFSFYYVPMLKRLIPDLLVMGRRREKLGCLLRLLAPSADWLRFYYKIPASQPVAPHYLWHPLKFIWHYCTEIFTHIRDPLRKHSHLQTSS